VLPTSLIGLRYAVSGVLGRGGMATVYRARHLGLDREVALKILDPDAGSAARGRIRFEREARNAARLDHPGCVRVLDYGACADGSRYLAMDCIDGPTLRAEITARPRSRLDTAAWIGAELCDALAHAHGAGVIHRDVKPENVMFAPTGAGWRVVLIDFGLSRLAGDAAVTAVGACIGSPSYLAPERALGGDGDARSDLYAVGVILYEMVAGRRPFVADGPAAIARMHLTDDALPLVARAPDVSPALAAIVERAMAKDPDRRFADAAAMAAALRPLIGIDSGERPALRTASTIRAAPSVVAGVASGETTWIQL
jgi:serine/threonine protein kinase